MILTVGWIRSMGIAAALIRSGVVQGSTRPATSAVMIRRFTRKISFNARSAANQCANHVLRMNLPSVTHVTATSA